MQAEPNDQVPAVIRSRQPCWCEPSRPVKRLRRVVRRMNVQLELSIIAIAGLVDEFEQDGSSRALPPYAWQHVQVGDVADVREDWRAGRFFPGMHKEPHPDGVAVSGGDEQMGVG